MSLVFRYNGSNLGLTVARLGEHGGYSTKAEAADVGSASVILDDVAGSLNILGLQRFTVDETDCAAVGADGVNGTRLYTGYTWGRNYRRGSSARPSLITAASREIEVSLRDINTYLEFRIWREGSEALTGTIDKASGNTTITGHSTTFLTSLHVGSTISIPGGGGTDILYVASIASDTSLTVVTAPTHTASGQTGTLIGAARPAETDVQRIRWVLSDPVVSALVTDDAGWVDTAGPVNMDAADYTGQTPLDTIHDCAVQSGKNYWVGYWEATGTFSLWYADSNTSTTYSSLLRISNVLDDVDNTTTFAPVSGSLDRDPTQTFTGEYVPYQGGYVYVNSAAGIYPARDGSAPNQNVATAAKATALANRLLADAADEMDRVNVSVQLPSTLATGIKAGQRIYCRFKHLPGYADWTWMRVMALQIAQDEPTDQRYTLSLELTPQTPVPAVPHILQVAHNGTGLAAGFNVVFDVPPTQGNTIVLFSIQWTALHDPSGNLSHGPWTNVVSPVEGVFVGQFPGPGGPATVGAWTRTVGAGEPTDVAGASAEALITLWAIEVAGGSTFTGNGAGSGQAAVGSNPHPYAQSVSLPAGAADSLLIAMIGMQALSYQGHFYPITPDNVDTLFIARGDRNGAYLDNSSTYGSQDGPGMILAYVQGTGPLETTFYDTNNNFNGVGVAIASVRVAP